MMFRKIICSAFHFGCKSGSRESADGSSVLERTEEARTPAIKTVMPGSITYPRLPEYQNYKGLAERVINLGFSGSVDAVNTTEPGTSVTLHRLPDYANQGSFAEYIADRGISASVDATDILSFKTNVAKASQPPPTSAYFPWTRSNKRKESLWIIREGTYVPELAPTLEEEEPILEEEEPDED